MKYLIRFYIVLILILVSGTFVCSQNISRIDAVNVFEQGVYRRLDARIMVINPADKEMVIAEKIIKLVTYVDNKGHVQYLTQFSNTAGKKIKLTDFKVRDRVVVEGVKLPDNTIAASSITKSK